MTDIIDIHTHTLASVHAYSTIREMAAAAKAKGLALLGISDHAPALPGNVVAAWLAAVLPVFGQCAASFQPA